MQIYNDEQLYHFGVKGMKWGHRTTKTFANSPKMLKKDAISTLSFQNESTKKASSGKYSREERKSQKQAYKDVMSGKVVRKQSGEYWNFSNEDLKTIDKARIEFGKRQTRNKMLKIGVVTATTIPYVVANGYLFVNGHR